MILIENIPVYGKYNVKIMMSFFKKNILDSNYGIFV